MRPLANRSGAGAASAPTLWLDPIPERYRQCSTASLADGDVRGFLHHAPAAQHIALVWANTPVLRRLALFELAVFAAFTAPGQRLNLPLIYQRRLLMEADPMRLRAAGDPLPAWTGPMRLYRGVAGGNASVRRVHGCTWCLTLGHAARYARELQSQPRPAVMTVRVVEPTRIRACRHEPDGTTVLMGAESWDDVERVGGLTLDAGSSSTGRTLR